MQRSHYFIALSIPSPIKDVLAGWQRDLCVSLPYKQWTHQDDLHITLKFLGEVDDQTLVKLHQMLKSVTSYGAFSVKVDSIGFFGKAGRPRVLWAGVKSNTALISVQKEVEMLANKIGFHKENRSYSPHITLAKKWNGQPNKKQIEKMKLAYQNQALKFVVTEIKLFKIHPDKRVKYEMIYMYPLE